MYSKSCCSNPEGVEELSKVISSTIEIIQHQEAKDGVSIKPNTDTDSEWIFKSDGWSVRMAMIRKLYRSQMNGSVCVMVQIVQKLLSPQ
jgi:hypothetical protein